MTNNWVFVSHCYHLKKTDIKSGGFNYWCKIGANHPKTVAIVMIITNIYRTSK